MQRSLQAGDHFRNAFPCDIWLVPAYLAQPQGNRPDTVGEFGSLAQEGSVE